MRRLAQRLLDSAEEPVRLAVIDNGIVVRTRQNGPHAAAQPLRLTGSGGGVRA